MTDCPETSCPLATADPLPKFCPECGALASSKVKTNACTSCSLDFGATLPKFCPECGTRTAIPVATPPTSDLPYGFERPAEPDTKVYGSLENLIATHEAQKRGLPGGTQGRGLTPEELARMERNARQQTKPDRAYVGPSRDDERAFQDISNLPLPSAEERERFGLDEHHVATHAKPGTHKPGLLSARGARLEPDYHNHVRVIPYSFRNPAHAGREMVGPRPSAVENEQLTGEDLAVFRREPGDEDVPDVVFPPKPRNL